MKTNVQNDKKATLKRLVLLIIVFMGICFIIPIIFYLIDTIPNYIQIPILAPENKLWDVNYCKTRSTFGSLFICIGEAKYPSWEYSKLVEIKDEYPKEIDKQLYVYGWKRDNNWAACDYYLSKYIELLRKPYLGFHYRREGYVRTYDEVEDDLVCVIIGNDLHLEEDITLLIATIRPSNLYQLFDLTG
jgi:hypothetical protein